MFTKPIQITVAEKYLGTKEGSGINKELTKYTGIVIDTTVVPWCALFASMVLNQANKPHIVTLSARKFLKYGTPTTTPKLGDIIVLSRGNSPIHGHVGFFIESKGNNILVLGGNQDNTVSYKLYAKDRVLGYRSV